VFPIVNDYSIDDGMLSQLVPYRVGDYSRYTKRTADYLIKGIRNADGSYTPLQWGNLDKDIYIDPISKNMGNVQRQTYILLSDQLLREGDTVAARAALDISEKAFPTSNFPNDRFALMMVFAYSHIGDQMKAYDILCDVFDYYRQQLDYVKQFPAAKANSVERMTADASYFLYQVVSMRNHGLMRNPFDNSPEVALTEQGAEMFAASSAENAARLKAIDDFASSAVYQNEIVPLVNSMR
jgi:hypothetical protein